MNLNECGNEAISRIAFKRKSTIDSLNTSKNVARHISNTIGDRTQNDSKTIQTRSKNVPQTHHKRHTRFKDSSTIDRRHGSNNKNNKSLLMLFRNPDGKRVRLADIQRRTCRRTEATFISIYYYYLSAGRGRARDFFCQK